MTDFKRFLWQSNHDGTYLVSDKTTGKEYNVTKHIGGKFTVDGCELKDVNFYGQETPHYFKNKFDVMKYLREKEEIL